MSSFPSLRSALLTSLLALPLLGCPGDDDDSTGDDDDAVDPCVDIAPVSGTDVEFETIGIEADRPVDIANAGDGSGRVFVVEQRGTIREYRPGETVPRTWFDINSQVVNPGGLGDERGLLSMAFHPNFASNGRFFVHYNNASADTTISEFSLDGDGDADASTERILLSVDQPASNHNGGSIKFGPDGYLYIGLGDGGGGDDTYDNGQNPNTLLAKILRIDVDNGDPYGIPSDNPFLDSNVVDEAYTWGMRNPWRFSFDRETGQMWIADVGQNRTEEIDIGLAGANYGWPNKEGSDCYQGPCDDSFEDPIFEYSHADGISITGGFVYRGCKMPDLHGQYFFSDFAYAPNSPLWSIKNNGGSFGPGDVWMGSTGLLIATFGEDEQGELLTAGYSSGDIVRMVPADR